MSVFRRRSGPHGRKAWSTTQTTVALSSGEAEYYSAVKGASEMLGLSALCSDLGIDVEKGMFIHTDSSACKGMCGRTGLGKVKHMEVPYLWLQDLVRKGKVIMKKVAGLQNPADLMTKYLSSILIRANLNRLGFDFVQGRSTVIAKL